MPPNTWLDGSSATRTWQEMEARLHTRVFNVRSPEFGAKGDGTTDDTAAIQAALTACAAAGGGTVLVPQGIYRVGTIYIDSFVTLRGAGIGSTVLKLKDSYVGDLLQTVGFSSLTGTTPPSNASGPKKFHLREITLDGNNLGPTGSGVAGGVGWCMRVFGVSYTVDHVEFVNGQYGGVYSEWRDVDGGADMETFFSNFKIKDWGMGLSLPTQSPTTTNGTGQGGYGIWWNGPHDTFFSNGVVATLNSSIRPESNPYSYGIYLQGVAMPNGTPGGAAGELFSNVHVWGRCHYGWYPHGGKMSCANCVAEGAFKVNVKLSTSTVWVGGEIYGNNNFYAATAGDEVGIEVGDADQVNGFNCSRAQVVGCFMTNFGTNGRWLDFKQTAGNNRFVISGHSASASAIYKGNIFLASDDFDIIVHNNPPLGFHNKAQFMKFQYGFGTWLAGAPNFAAPAADFGRPVGESMMGAIQLDGTNEKLWAVMSDNQYAGTELRRVTAPQNSFGPGSPEGVVAAPKGSTWNRTDGGAGTSFYVKESGTGNTGWVAK